MKKWFILFLTTMLLFTAAALAENNEVLITLSEDGILVDGQPITEDPSAKVYLALETETHEDVAEELQGVVNRTVTITDAGAYRFSGAMSDASIAVRAGDDDQVRIILDGVDLTCRTSAAIKGYSAYDSRVAGAYGLTIELVGENKITGSHTVAMTDDDVEFDGAIGSQVSLGFEGEGSLMVDADNEGAEVSQGHMTINGGSFYIQSCDDPLNVSEDGFGVLTVNDGYLYSAVKPEEGGEGDGIDSNGYIVFNGGVAINLAHPTSGDSGIDSDMGSSINGGIIVGAGNMYDPIEENSQQLFMMLEFGQATNDLVVVTDENDVPVFAYDFPHDYMYIAFSTPELQEGTYRVYLGGEIEGEQRDGLYTTITSYVPGERMQHGGGTAQQRGGMQMPDMSAMPDMQDMVPPEGFDPGVLAGVDLNEILKDTDLNELLKDADLNQLLSGFSVTDILTEEQIAQYFGDVDVEAMQGMNRGGRGFGGGFGGGMGGPRAMESSADTATGDFHLTHSSTSFTNVVAAE